jgi:GTPase SAR1 family protein
MGDSGEDTFQFKVVLVGDSRVGKTAFLKRFTDAYFTTDMHPTIGVDLRMHDFKVNGKTVKLEVRLGFGWGGGAGCVVAWLVGAAFGRGRRLWCASTILLWVLGGMLVCGTVFLSLWSRAVI